MRKALDSKMHRLGFVLIFFSLLLSTPVGGFQSRTGKIVAVSGSRFAVLLPSGRVFLLNTDGREVPLCDLPLSRGGLTPIDMTAAPDGQTIYIALTDYSEASAIGICSLPERVSTEKSSMSIQFIRQVGTFSSITCTEREIILANVRTGELLFLDRYSFASVSRRALKANDITWLGYEPGEHTVWALDSDSGRVLRMPENDPSSTQVVPWIVDAELISVDWPKGLVYVLKENGDITRSSPNAVNLFLNLNPRKGLFGMAVSDDGKLLALLTFDGVSVYDTKTKALSRRDSF